MLERTQGESFYPYLERAVLQPMGLDQQRVPTDAGARSRGSPKASMWTLDGRRFAAPTFQLGMGPCGSMYSTVLDLGRFFRYCFARGVTPNGQRMLAAATIDSMWTPQFARAGRRRRASASASTSARSNGHRTIGHDGAIYGFATTLLALPDDSLGVVVTATLDGVNAVTDHIAQAALRAAARRARRDAGRRARHDDGACHEGARSRSSGRYENARNGVDLEEYEGRLYLTPLRGGSRAELRVPVGQRTPSGHADLVDDDALAFGQRVASLGDGPNRASAPTR